MEEITLQAQKRNLLGKKVNNLRKDGQLPSILYGKNTKEIPLTLNKAEFDRISRDAGEATIIDLRIPDEKPAKVLIRDIQRHPVSDDIIHVDLYKVDMSQEIQTEIPLRFEGTAPAVEELEGNLITNKDSIKVECLPDKLISEIIVDVSSLKTFDDLIHIKDLNIPEGIEVLDDGEEIIAQVTPPRSEEELAELEAEPAAAAETEKAQIETMEAEAAAAKAEGAAAEEGAETPAAPTSSESVRRTPSESSDSVGESRPKGAGKEQQKEKK